MIAKSLSSPANDSKSPFVETQQRKADHIRVCLEQDVQCQTTTTGLENYRFQHCCLPELDWADLDIGSTFLGKALRAPLLISSMTGGTEQAQVINTRLAIAAQTYGLAMGVGSQRVAVESPEVMPTFSVRRYAPDCLLFANLGAVQLNYGYGLSECQQVVDALEADALILHLNVLQESVQTRGDRNFKGLLPKIEQLCDRLPVPVIAKEVGNGISGPLAQRLIDVGVAAIDVAGAGGTSWAKVEGGRATDLRQRRLGQTFGDWGWPTADCIEQIRAIAPTIPLIASGGIRNGLEAAKALALGADLVGLAHPFLMAANESEDSVALLAQCLTEELKTVLFCTDNANLAALQRGNALQHLKG
ncbi:type 2 isopentenyl-diphosphate Delta-isomerase [Oscillatoria sp. CS-180]|uniref:type 2 isopentenyl-diphosphate Delta-isomerase n=1 Tax=Oscillatoria sp. CS-180 TaxID=3021720 RepID=UPI00232AAE4E|nr:type 2 isopentenyl-diphosphate Delta-isomerase [Oscillatoria sp. CS-180]MDB9529468.1 type 2 isopentenyl-diphosphate Delta-isomerase [Oscillatoria sp. CS-180]